MRSESEFLTQVAVGVIPCALHDFCAKKSPLPRVYPSIHNSYKEYMRCLGAYIEEMVRNTTQDDIRKDYNSEAFQQLRSKLDAEYIGLDFMADVARRFGFHLCTVLIEEVDRKFHANLDKIVVMMLEKPCVPQTSS